MHAPEHPRSAVLLALLLSTGITSPLLAQIQQSRLTGRVTDASGGALPGVTVSASSPVLAGVETAVTDETGSYRFPALPPGRYDVTFELTGFETARRTRIDLKGGEVVVLDEELSLATLSETVDVVAEAPRQPPPTVRRVLRPAPKRIVVPEFVAASVCGPRQPSDFAIRVARIAAHRDEAQRQLYGGGDVLVLDAGIEQGLEPSRNFVVRRRFRVGEPRKLREPAPMGEHTAGLIQIVEAETRTSVAVVVYACDEFVSGDSVEPYEPQPMWTSLPDGTPDFDEPARILFGDEGQTMAGPAQLMVIDRGTQAGAAPGQRLTVFRRTFGETGPISEIADAVIVAVATGSATIRIERAKDAVMVGDRVALHR